MRSHRQSILDRLNPYESRAVLMRLLSTHLELVHEAEEAACNVLSEISFQKIADEFEKKLKSCRLPQNAETNDLSKDETIFDDCLQPFLDKIQFLFEFDLETEALEVCKGILLTLYTWRRHEIGLLFPELAHEAAAQTLIRWQHAAQAYAAERSRQPIEFPIDFIQKKLSAWADFIQSTLSN